MIIRQKVAQSPLETAFKTAHLLVPCDPERPALLQYTSGSTSKPRGVTLSHGNLAANTHAATAEYAGLTLHLDKGQLVEQSVQAAFSGETATTRMEGDTP